VVASSQITPLIRPQMYEIQTIEKI